MIVFDTYWALYIAIIFISLSVYLYRQSRGIMLSGLSQLRFSLTLLVGTAGLVAFCMWPNREEPYLLDNSNAYVVSSVFGDSLFAMHSCQSDTDITIYTKRNRPLFWPKNLGAVDTSLGILHTRLVSAIGLSIVFDWHFVGSDEFDYYFISKLVRVREQDSPGKGLVR